MPAPISVNFEHCERQFTFQIHERQLLFGNAGTGQYFWMDGRQLRRGQGGPNFRPCVDLWWHTVEHDGVDRVIDNEMTLVFAECYPLVNTARAVQQVYIDAHLHCTADREYVIEDEDGIRRIRSDRTYLLPDEECERLRNVAHSRDLDRIREELEGLFMGETPPLQEMPAYQEAAQAWLGNGVHALRTEGREGLQRYTGTVDEWIRRYRRRGNLDHVRRFINMFSYECKVAFYMCYCNAWIGILRWLEQNREPNPLGVRFMRYWHHQNRPADDSAVSRDAFCGQVLALHPLSAVVLTSPEHLTVIGNWIGHSDYEAIMNSGRMGECDAYWDFVATILIAAHEYDRSRRRWRRQRGEVTLVDSGTVAQETRDDSIASARLLFEDYVAARGYVCDECSGTLAYERYEAVEEDRPAVVVFYRCQSCGRERAIEVVRNGVER